MTVTGKALRSVLPRTVMPKPSKVVAEVGAPAENAGVPTGTAMVMTSSGSVSPSALLSAISEKIFGLSEPLTGEPPRMYSVPL